jgi:hypothetical protein
MGHRSIASKGRAHETKQASAGATSGTAYDLKFVPIGMGAQRAGGWYRELPDDQLEVMSRGQLERVPLENADPEEKAKSVVRDMLQRNYSPRTLQR